MDAMKEYFLELIEEGDEWQFMRGQQAEHIFMIGMFARKLLNETKRHEPKIQWSDYKVNKYCKYKTRQLENFIRVL